MTPFFRATVDPKERERVRQKTIADLMKRPKEQIAKALELEEGEEFDITDVIEMVDEILAEEDRNNIFRNDTYQVSVRRIPELEGRPEMLHLSIKRIDRQVIHDWRELQEIKNLIVGPENEAVELYPAESRCVDTANQYHLWAIANPGFRFPFGFAVGLKSEGSVAGSVQRPFAEGVS